MSHASGVFGGRAIGLTVLTLLLSSSVWVPFSQPPVVTALSELWTVAMAGLACMVLGVLAWRESPVVIAGFPGHSHAHPHPHPHPHAHPPAAQAAPSPWPRVLMGAVAAGALVSAGIGFMQVLAPELLAGPLGHLIQASHLSGRAVGHLRQPNLLATLLVWGSIAWVVLVQASAMRAPMAWLGHSVLVSGVVLTGSRTGMLALSLLVLWGLFDKRLSRMGRALLIASPLIALAAGFTLQFLTLGNTGIGSTAALADPLRASAGGDISSSRFAIWRNTLTLIQMHPWTGVGWGHFNIAWTLTPFPDRPTALFDHAHNLPLHLMVELGIPLGLLVSISLVAVVAWAGWQAWRDEGPQALWRRAAFMLLPVVGLHSLLEYPLWYAQFLLPSLAAWWVAAGWDGARPRTARWKAVGLMVLGGTGTAWAAWAQTDYQTVRAIYAPQAQEGPLAERLARGQQVIWFRAHADYAVATNVRPIPGRNWTPSLEQAFKGAPRVLLDARLMMAWADALAARGQGDGDDLDRARALASRLREFKSPAAQAWLARCSEPQASESTSGSPAFWTCDSPKHDWPWRGFIDPDHPR